MSDGPGKGFSRWSQRKHAARVAARGSTAPAALKDADDSVRPDVQLAPTVAERDHRPADAPADATAIRERELGRPSDDARPPLPSIEELTADSDYTQFLADGVPEALKRAALRKLWTSDPVLACLDGLNDYDEDFNVIDQVISPAQTDYKVGRGYLDEPEPESVGTPETATELVQDQGTIVEPHADENESETRPIDAAHDETPLESGAVDGQQALTADAPDAPVSDARLDNDPTSKG